MSDAVGGLSTVVLLMLVAMIWQGIHVLILARRLKRQRRVLANHERALTALTVMGLLTDNDWDRGVRVRRRREVTIEPSIPLRDHDHLTGTGQPARVRRPDPLPWKPVPPIGGAGNSGAR